jgi:hypothetical protein
MKKVTPTQTKRNRISSSKPRASCTIAVMNGKITDKTQKTRKMKRKPKTTQILLDKESATGHAMANIRISGLYVTLIQKR